MNEFVGGKCPYCGGKLKRKENELLCPFCGSEFTKYCAPPFEREALADAALKKGGAEPAALSAATDGAIAYKPSAGVIAVSTPAELAAINTCLSNNYELKCDIDLSGINWLPIGSTDAPFTGVLDGNGFTVSGLKISGAFSGKENSFGLFGAMLRAEVYSLNISDADIKVTAEGILYAGILAGKILKGSKILGARVSGRVNAESAADAVFAGGFAGRAAGNLNSCFSDAAVTASGAEVFAGAFCGVNGGRIFNSCCFGSVKAPAAAGRPAGFSAINEFAGKICNSFSAAEIAGSGGFCIKNNGHTVGCIMNSDTVKTAVPCRLCEQVSTFEMQSGFKTSGWSEDFWQFCKGKYPALRLIK